MKKLYWIGVSLLGVLLVACSPKVTEKDSVLINNIDENGVAWYSDKLPVHIGEKVTDLNGKEVDLPIQEEGLYLIVHKDGDKTKVGLDKQKPHLKFVNSSDVFDLYKKEKFIDNLPGNAVSDGLSGYSGTFIAKWKDGKEPAAMGNYIREYVVYDRAGNASPVFSHPVYVYNSNGKPAIEVAPNFDKPADYSPTNEFWYKKGPVTVSLTVKGGDGHYTYEWKVDNQTVENKTASFQMSDIEDGTEKGCRISCLVKDGGGQPGSVRFILGIDKKAPVIKGATAVILGLTQQERRDFIETESLLNIEEAGSGIKAIEGKYNAPLEGSETYQYGVPYPRTVTVTDNLGNISNDFHYSVTFDGNNREEDEKLMMGTDPTGPSANPNEIAIPSDEQYQFINMENYAFIHFGPNSFNNVEWGNAYPKDAQNFQPTAHAIDFTRTWVEDIASLNFKAIILTVKHHDGFCLWDTKTTQYSVCKKGENYQYYDEDILKALIINLKEWNIAHPDRALKIGLYLSPWDRNNWTYLGKEPGAEDDIKSYPYINAVYRTQLSEILSYVQTYGEGKVDLLEVWLDGANQESGWYGGESYDKLRKDFSVSVEVDAATGRAKKETFKDSFNTVANFEKKTKFQNPWHHNRQRPKAWGELIHGMTRQILDSYESFFGNKAVIFGREIRWIGNEQGWAAMDNWSTSGGKWEEGAVSINRGSETSNVFCPGEVDMKTQMGWFFTPNENKGEKKMIEYWYRSVGRNANLLLNFSPNTAGQIPRDTYQSALIMSKTVQKDLSENLMKYAKTVKASEIRNNHKQFSPYNVIDGKLESYWSVSDGRCNEANKGTEEWIEVDFAEGSPIEFNRIVLQEQMRLGQRVKAFKVEYKSDIHDTTWKPVEFATFPTSIEGDPSTKDETLTIGHKRILRTVKTKAEAVRVTFTKYRKDKKVPVNIAEFGLYKAAN